MVRLMIDNSIGELFKVIEESKEYNDYLKVKDKIEKSKEINELVMEIKSLQQKATKLEHNNDSKYHEIDKLTKEKVDKLNNISLYKEYLSKMQKLNNILKKSSKMIEDYINEKI